jgi:hypothetical protein
MGRIVHFDGEYSNLVGRNDDMDAIELTRRELIYGKQDTLVVKILCAISERAELWSLPLFLERSHVEELLAEWYNEPTLGTVGGP